MKISEFIKKYNYRAISESCCINCFNSESDQTNMWCNLYNPKSRDYGSTLYILSANVCDKWEPKK